MTWTLARPRTCPSPGAMVCTYRCWSLRHSGHGGRPFFELRLLHARSHSFYVSTCAATGYLVTWDAIGLILCHSIDVGAPGVMVGGETKITWFSNDALQHIRDKYSAIFLVTTRCDLSQIRPTRNISIISSLSAWIIAPRTSDQPESISFILPLRARIATRTS